MNSFLNIDPNFTDYAIHLGYLGILIWFVTVDQLTPIPEEVTLLTIGYLSAHHVFNPVLAGMVSLVSFLLVDMAYYFLARSGNKLINKAYQRKNHFLQKYTEKLKTHMTKTLFLLCFIPRMRLFGPILVGSLNLSFKKFLLVDGLALSLFAVIYIALGMFFHNGLHALLEEMESVRHALFATFIIIIAWLIIHSMHIKKPVE